MELPQIQAIVKKYGLNADKSFGQNFLFDLNLTDKIARRAGKIEGGMVVEIGPGPGALTRSIVMQKPKKLIAIDADARCVEALTDYLLPVSEGCLHIIHGDALQVSLSAIVDGKCKIIANLPYNISTVLLFKWLEQIEYIDSMTLMFQREVAKRITAKPGCKDYGRLSVMTQFLCHTEHQFDIPPSAFYPPPKVTSSVITITPREKPVADIDRSKLDLLVRTLFNQRRKTAKSTLKSLTTDPSSILARLSIKENARPEELTVEQFCELAVAI